VTEVSERINRIIDSIKDRELRAMLHVCKSSGKYPKDCLTDGALELMARRIRAMEVELERLGAEKDDTGGGSGGRHTR
jgi:hypothetical protein